MVAAETLHGAELRLARYYARKLQAIHEQYQNGGAALTHALNGFDHESAQIRQWGDYAINHTPANAEYDDLAVTFARYLIPPRYSFTERTHWLQVGLEAAKRLEDRDQEAHLLEMLSFIALERGDIENGRTYAEQSLLAARAAGSETAIGWALIRLADAAGWSGDFDSAEAAYQQVLASKAMDTNARAVLYNIMSRIAAYRGEITQAIQFTQNAMEFIQQRGDLQRLAVALSSLGVFSYMRGDLEESDRHLSESLRLKRVLNDRITLPTVLSMRTLIALDRGQLNQAYLFSAEQEALSREVGSPKMISYAYSQYAAIEQMRGNYAEASHHFQKALASIQVLNNTLMEQEVIIRRVRLLTDMGDYRQAETACRDWLSDTELPKDPNDVWLAHFGLGMVARADGALAKALTHFQDALASVEGVAVTLLEIYSAIAEIQLQLGNFSGAEESFQQANAVEQEHSGRLIYELPRVRTVQVKLALYEGRMDQARQALCAALDLADGLEVLLPRLNAIEAAAEYLAAADDPRCLRLFSLIAQHPGTPDLMRRDTEKRRAELAVSFDAKTASSEWKPGAEASLGEMIRSLSDELKL